MITFALNNRSTLVPIAIWFNNTFYFLLLPFVSLITGKPHAKFNRCWQARCILSLPWKCCAKAVTHSSCVTTSSTWNNINPNFCCRFFTHYESMRENQILYFILLFSCFTSVWKEYEYIVKFGWFNVSCISWECLRNGSGDTHFWHRNSYVVNLPMWWGFTKLCNRTMRCAKCSAHSRNECHQCWSFLETGRFKKQGTEPWGLVQSSHCQYLMKTFWIMQ